MAPESRQQESRQPWDWVAGWALVVSGALYAVFFGLDLVSDGFGDGFWIVGLSAHAVLIVLTILGLVKARSLLRLEGWASSVWNASTVFAFLGLTVGHPMWSLALLGVAIVAFTEPGGVVVPALLTTGALGWLYLFLSGVRVGDDNGPTPTDGQIAIGVVAVTLMALGLIGLGLSLRRSPASAVASV
jgi:hypothetical protein